LGFGLAFGFVPQAHGVFEIRLEKGDMLVRE
jgi:hypothetical protein